MTFADKLIRLRKQQGLSQEELADKLNVSRQAISKWESAQSAPDLQNVIQISNLFGVSLDYLLKDEIEDTGVSLEVAQQAEDHAAQQITQNVAAQGEDKANRLTLAQTQQYWETKRAQAKLLARALGLGLSGVLLIGVMAVCSLTGFHVPWYYRITGVIIGVIMVGVGVKFGLSFQNQVEILKAEYPDDIQVDEESLQYLQEQVAAKRGSYLSNLSMGMLFLILAIIPGSVGIVYWGAILLVGGTLMSFLAIVGIVPIVLTCAQWETLSRLVLAKGKEKPGNGLRIYALSFAVVLVIYVIMMLVEFATSEDVEFVLRFMVLSPYFIFLMPLHTLALINFRKLYYGGKYLDTNSKKQ